MIILASSSPRRHALLRQAGIEFEIQVPDVDETFDEQLPIDEQVLDVASRKASAVTRNENDIVIAADTTVVIDKELLAKPVDQEDARRMLIKLSGVTHQVKTAVVIQGKMSHRFVETTDVTFHALSEEDLISYLNTHEWVGKAGAYAIQGTASNFVKAISGDLDNVIGLPITKIKELLS